MLFSSDYLVIVFAEKTILKASMFLEQLPVCQVICILFYIDIFILKMKVIQLLLNFVFVPFTYYS